MAPESFGRGYDAISSMERSIHVREMTHVIQIYYVKNIKKRHKKGRKKEGKNEEQKKEKKKIQKKERMTEREKEVSANRWDSVKQFQVNINSIVRECSVWIFLITDQLVES